MFPGGIERNIDLTWVKVSSSLTREKCPYSEFFWPVFSRIWTEYGEIRSISVFSPNAGKYRPEKLQIRALFTQCLEVFFPEI